MRRSALLSFAAAAALLLASCTGGGDAARSPESSPSGVWRGGTLRIADTLGPKALDPQKVYSADSWELLRCCLVRTLLSYNGRPTAEGGATLRPDLAAEMPEVSADGLTWTFRLKPGLHYAPPFEDVEIVAGDIVRALRREADPRVTPEGSACEDWWACGYPSYYSVIRGFEAVRKAKASTIPGLEVPDDHTLIVRLTKPTGDLGNRLAMPAAAPIPDGATDGHGGDYGPFLVASGPYMIEGSENLDFSLPPDEQEPVAGYTMKLDQQGSYLGPGSLRLVRNPSWNGADDHLRRAYVDRIEMTMPRLSDAGLELRRGAERLAALVDAGGLDLVFGWSKPPSEQVRRYLGDPELRDRLLQAEANTLQIALVNLAVPPFDDVHVRRAVNLVIDRAAIRKRLNSGWFWRDGSVSAHTAPDSLETNLLLDYRPSWMPATTPDLEAARAEMRHSRYDVDGDGRCEVPVCSDVLTLAQRFVPGETEPFGWPGLVRDDLEAIGITMDTRVIADVGELVWSLVPADEEKWALALCTACGWIPDYPNASNFFDPVLYGPRIGAHGLLNISLLGATPEQLSGWGFEVTEVPSADARIERCLDLFGDAQVHCWTELDQYLTEDVVPWVPLLVERNVFPLSDRVAHASIDQFTAYPALDQISLVPGSE